MMIRIIVAGASGKMGQEVVKLIQRVDHFQLACGVSRSTAGRDVGEVIGIGEIGAPMVASVTEALQQFPTDVLVDFTTPQTVLKNALSAFEKGVRPVIGTSGLQEDDMKQLAKEAELRKIGGIVAPNFAIGAVLMMRFAAEAAKYLPDVEIIESHHDQKLDAPSGTAIKTAEGIALQREEKVQGHPQEEEVLDGARGAFYHGFRIHSVRLPGLVAHQEVLFGGAGQMLTIRHDSYHRESFMPGVQLAIEKIIERNDWIYGLENLLD
jgi:4-hydroxy-tetrahydrodipicolinate reductase